MAKIVSGNYSDEYVFESRYKIAEQSEQNPRTVQEAQEGYRNLAKKNIAMLQKPGRASGMRYFDRIMESPDIRMKDLSEFKQKGGKVVGVFCVQVPEELILAAGALPIRLECGFIGNMSASEEAMPTNVCPMCRSSLGGAIRKTNPFFGICDVIVVPTTCDCKKKMAEILANYANVWPLELPNNRDHLEARDYWLGQVSVFAKKLEKLTGNKISVSGLQGSIRKLQARTSVFRQFLDMRKQKKIVISGRDSLLVAQSAMIDDAGRWTNAVSDLNRELIQMLQQEKTVFPENTPRLMMTGSPMAWPSWKVINIIEESDAVVIAEDSCTGTEYLYNPAEVADWSMKGMMSGVADKYLLPTICPVFVHSDDRIDSILERKELFHAEGIIYHLLRLCQCIDMEYSKVNAVLKSKGIPALRIETEYGEEDVGQIKTRIEAFVEMVEARRK
jgi:benzoyl-CoA reductase/2-hydroxyglutaryl-CoA dehydratase subunit BcrC/BadD/HgdB